MRDCGFESHRAGVNGWLEAFSAVFFLTTTSTLVSLVTELSVFYCSILHGYLLVNSPESKEDHMGLDETESISTLEDRVSVHGGHLTTTTV
ncbi:hypothetical protein IMY05_014G0147300 [Salix suchowensis]|nr:hypothetical protein IMY05_014G0147300 [Salix suchowensis]